MTPHTARPAPRATTNVCKIVIAEVKNAINSSLSAAMRPDKLIVSFCRPDRFFTYPSGFGQKNSGNPLTATKKAADNLRLLPCCNIFTAYHIQFSFLQSVPVRRTCLINYIFYCPISFSTVLPLLFRIFLTCLHLNQVKLLICPQYQPVFQITFHVKGILLVIV